MHGSTRMTNLFLTSVLAGLFTLTPVLSHAMSLSDAKAQGFLGETISGYLGLVTPSAPADAKALMSDVNGKRKQKYQEIAKRNGTKVAAVEALAGKTAMSKTKKGHYVQLPDGSWKKKQ